MEGRRRDGKAGTGDKNRTFPPERLPRMKASWVKVGVAIRQACIQCVFSAPPHKRSSSVSLIFADGLPPCSSYHRLTSLLLLLRPALHTQGCFPSSFYPRLSSLILLTKVVIPASPIQGFPPCSSKPRSSSLLLLPQVVFPASPTDRELWVLVDGGGIVRVDEGGVQQVPAGPAGLPLGPVRLHDVLQLDPGAAK